jgi:hypothetical protein
MLPFRARRRSHRLATPRPPAPRAAASPAAPRPPAARLATARPPAPRAPLTVVFVTRFSILDAGARGWVLTREAGGDAERVAAALFDEGRLSAKMRCFETVTAPSVRSLRGSNPVLWLIYTAEKLPAAWKDRLRAAAAGAAAGRAGRRGGAATCAEVAEVADMGAFTRALEARLARVRGEAGEAGFASVRLDDDDGVAASYCERLERARGGAEVVTFPRGRRYTVDGEGRVVLGAAMRWDLIALGLARLGGNIHACGDHTKIRERFRVRADEAPEMYLCFCGEASDTKRRFVGR